MAKYTDERNAQIVIELLKKNNIRKVIASPGTTNVCLIASMQSDGFFELYSAPEERSAAYMACGMAAETGEPVVLSCTGATASRNYMPGLTEAFYRKLPILFITSSRRNAFIGHNMHQITDRTLLPRDIANLSVQMPVVFDEISEWQNIIACNKAMLELKHRGGGPVHINLETTYSKKTVESIDFVKKIERYTNIDKLPLIPEGRIAIFVGNHRPFSKELTEAVDSFCATHNAVVLCDHTSNYKGRYRVFASLLCTQSYAKSPINNIDLLIHIGNVSTADVNMPIKEVWRVDSDGELRDTFMKLTSVFEMSEQEFFARYSEKNGNKTSYYEECVAELANLYDRIPELPFSSVWMASVTESKLPEKASLHLGIRNSLKTWNYFDVPESVSEFSNTGGFGIDGSISSVMGAALTNPDKIYFCVLGDLAFFYDINVFGNRHFPNNIRILLVNNGLGFEMRGSFTLGHKISHEFGINEECYVAAAGHYSQNDNQVVKNFVENLGCEYIFANSKEEYLNNLEKFINPNITDKSIVFETHVSADDEDMANSAMSGIIMDSSAKVKGAIKGILGESKFNSLKDSVKKVIK